jgi:hypothetical protein
MRTPHIRKIRKILLAKTPLADIAYMVEKRIEFQGTLFSAAAA